MLTSDMEVLQEQLQKLVVENNVLKDQLNLAGMSLSPERVQQIITESKKEIESNLEN